MIQNAHDHARMGNTRLGSCTGMFQEDITAQLSGLAHIINNFLQGASRLCRYGEPPAAALAASLEAYEQAIQEGAAPPPLPLYMEGHPPIPHLDQYVSTLARGIGKHHDRSAWLTR